MYDVRTRIELAAGRELFRAVEPIEWRQVYQFALRPQEDGVQHGRGGGSPAPSAGSPVRCRSARHDRRPRSRATSKRRLEPRPTATPRPVDLWTPWTFAIAGSSAGNLEQAGTAVTGMGRLSALDSGRSGKAPRNLHQRWPMNSVACRGGRYLDELLTSTRASLSESGRSRRRRPYCDRWWPRRSPDPSFSRRSLMRCSLFQMARHDDAPPPARSISHDLLLDPAGEPSPRGGRRPEW